jgi:hypothetical protein
MVVIRSGIGENLKISQASISKLMENKKKVQRGKVPIGERF